MSTKLFKSLIAAALLVAASANAQVGFFSPVNTWGENTWNQITTDLDLTSSGQFVVQIHLGNFIKPGDYRTILAYKIDPNQNRDAMSDLVKKLKTDDHKHALVELAKMIKNSDGAVPLWQFRLRSDVNDNIALYHVDILRSANLAITDVPDVQEYIDSKHTTEKGKKILQKVFSDDAAAKAVFDL